VDKEMLVEMVIYQHLALLVAVAVVAQELLD
jgi:hypothetical protein